MQSSRHTKIMLISSISMMIVLVVAREIFWFPRLSLLPNPDVSWLVYAAGRVIDGERLYVDIMETNPPLIIWLSMLPAYIGKNFLVQPLLIVPWLVLLLNILSLALSAKMLSRQELLRDKQFFPYVLLYIASVFFLFSSLLYAQREFLFVTLVLPYLFRSLQKDEDQSKNITDIWVISLAAIGFAIKPFFLVLWVVNELHVAIEKRNLLLLFRWHNWLIALVQLAYALIIYFFYREYIEGVLPILQTTYFTYESAWPSLWEIIFTISLPTIILALLTKPEAGVNKILVRAFLWMFGCALIIILQRKEWINHLYPMSVMAGFIIITLLLFLIKIFREKALNIGIRRFFALSLVGIVLVFSVWVNVKFWQFIYRYHSPVQEKLIAEINKHADGQYVYPMSFNIQAAFPVISVSKGIFRGRFHHLWPMAGLIIREQEGIKTPEITKAKQFFYEGIVRDFNQYPPQLVWVNENIDLEKNKEYHINQENKNIIEVLSRNPDFAEVWKNYEKIGEISGDAGQMQLERYSLYTRIKQVKETNEQ